MNIHEQNTLELTQLGRLIEPITVAMLTTADADGQLISRPMSALEMDGEGALWFFTDLSSAKVHQLRRVNLSFGDHDTSSYVSISGEGSVKTDREHIKSLWSSFIKPWFPDGPDSPNLALLKIVPHSAEYWDAPHSKMVRMFAMAASVIAAKPIGMGDNERLDNLSPNAARAA